MSATATKRRATPRFLVTAGSRQFQGSIDLRAMSIAGELAEAQLDEYLASVGAGIGAAHTRRVEKRYGWDWR